MEIPLTQGKIAIVDDADGPLVLRYKWHAHESEPGRFYAAAYGGGGRRNRKYLYMHNLLTGFPLTDHKDGDGLNNQRHNLRGATTSQNHANRRKTLHPTSSRFKGVYFDKSRGKWAADVKWNRKRYRLGRFDSEEEAAAAYQAAAVRLFGEFARF